MTILDGKKTEKEEIDVKHDAYKSGYQDGILPVQEPLELSEVLKEMNKDEINPSLNMTDMDMKARLHPIEATALNVFDACIQFRFLPTKALPVSRQKKRLSVSHFGEGRKEYVEVASAGIQRKSGEGFWNRVKNVFVPDK